MIYNYFLWNGISSLNFGWIKELPFPFSSMMNFEYTSIPGYSTSIVTCKNTRNKITISIELQLKDRNGYNEVYSWLNNENKQGTLILSDDLQKFYKATCSSVKTNYKTYNISSININFDCFPFRYSVSNQPTKLSESSIITVDGNYYSEPKIVVYGSGNGNLIVNDEIINVSVDDYVVLDTELGLAYKDNAISMFQTAGDFPKLYPGENSIYWNGGITSVEVFKNERWL